MNGEKKKVEPQNWEKDFEEVCGEDMYSDTAYSGWTNTGEAIKDFIRNNFIPKADVQKAIDNLPKVAKDGERAFESVREAMRSYRALARTHLLHALHISEE